MRPSTRRYLLQHVSSDEADHWKAHKETSFFGKQGAGCVFFAKDTQRFLIAHRSSVAEGPLRVEQPGTWGTWGGAIDSGENPKEAVRREMKEELGFAGRVELVPVFVFSKGTFRYSNFIAVVDEEFRPKLNWENQGYKWCEYGKWPQPLHFGLRDMLDDSATDKTLRDLIAGSRKPVTSAKVDPNIGRTWIGREGGTRKVDERYTMKDGREVYLVSTDGSRTQDIFPIADLEKEIALETRIYESNKRSREESRKQQAADDAKEALRTSLDGFEKTLTNMQRGRAIQSLIETGMRVNGRVYNSRRDAIRAVLKDYDLGVHKGQPVFFSKKDPEVFLEGKPFTSFGMAYAHYLSQKKIGTFAATETLALFDKPVEYEWKQLNAQRSRAVWTINGVEYKFDATQEVWDGDEECVVIQYGLSTASANKLNGGNPMAPTNLKNPVPVISTVRAITNEYFRRFKPPFVVFYDGDKVASRKRVYDRLADDWCKQFGYTLDTNEMAKATEQYAFPIWMLRRQSTEAAAKHNQAEKDAKYAGRHSLSDDEYADWKGIANNYIVAINGTDPINSRRTWGAKNAEAAARAGRALAEFDDIIEVVDKRASKISYWRAVGMGNVFRLTPSEVKKYLAGKPKPKPRATTASLNTYYHGSPYTSLRTDMSNWAPGHNDGISLTRSRDVAHKYAMGNVSTAIHDPKDAPRQPTIYEVALQGEPRLFDMRSKDHQVMYPSLRDAAMKHPDADSFRDLLPKDYTRMTNNRGLVPKPSAQYLAEPLKQAGFDGMWLDDDSYGATLRIFDPPKFVRINNSKIAHSAAAAPKQKRTMPDTYEEAKFLADRIEAELQAAKEAWRKVPGYGERGPMGLHPEHIRLSPAFRKAKADWDAANAHSRAFHTVFQKKYKKEIRQDRDAKRAAQLALRTMTKASTETSLLAEIRKRSKCKVEVANVEYPMWKYAGGMPVVLLSQETIAYAASLDDVTREKYLFDPFFGIISHEHAEASLTLRLLSSGWRDAEKKYPKFKWDRNPVVSRLKNTVVRQKAIDRFLATGDLHGDLENFAGIAHEALIAENRKGYWKWLDQHSKGEQKFRIAASIETLANSAEIVTLIDDAWTKAIGPSGSFVLNKWYPVVVKYNGVVRRFAAHKAKGSGPLRLTVLVNAQRGPEFHILKLDDKKNVLAFEGAKNLWALTEEARAEQIAEFENLFKHSTAASIETLAAPPRHDAIEDSVRAILRRVGLTSRHRNMVEVRRVKAGNIIHITSAVKVLTYKKLLRIKAFLMQHFKATNFVMSPKVINSRPFLQFSMLVKQVKKPKAIPKAKREGKLQSHAAIDRVVHHTTMKLNAALNERR